MEKESALLGHMEDLARTAQKLGACHSKFLSPSEIALVQKAYAARADIGFCAQGGFEQPERAIAVFIEPSWGGYDVEDFIAALALRYRKQDSIQHRDILGAVLGLGLERDVLGDIFVGEGESYLVCLASMEQFLAQELNKVARVGITVCRIPLCSLPQAPLQLREMQVSLASLRLDAVLAAAFGYSRSKAATCILSGRVQVDHCECLQLSKTLHEGQLVSLRKGGRFRLMAVEGLSRKGRQRVLLGFYS